VRSSARPVFGLHPYRGAGRLHVISTAYAAIGKYDVGSGTTNRNPSYLCQE